MEIFLSELTLLGALVEGETPQPRFRALCPDLPMRHNGTLRPDELATYGKFCAARTLPYRMQDRYTRSTEPVTVKTIVMENEFLRAVFLPGYGGKLWSLYNKEENRELLFVNPALRPSNLANRNAWLAGGIEWNLGHRGHFAFTCDDLFCAQVTAPDGETFLRMYEYEATHAQVLQLDFHLPNGTRQLGVHVRITNARNTQAPLYWWTNTAAVLTPQTRVFSGTADILYQLPPDEKTLELGFGRGTMPIQPGLACDDISYPWNIPHSVEYFFQNPAEEVAPWEVSIHGDCHGFMERSTQPLFARKMFCWGTGAGGRHWCDFLALEGQGDYMEIQAGLAPTQNHSATLPANGVVAFTQLFGAFTAPPKAQSEAWNDALGCVRQAVEQTLPQSAVLCCSSDYESKALLPAHALLHSGSGYGALENLRRAAEGESVLCEHLDFTQPRADHVLGWQTILNGQPPVHTNENMPLPYLTDAVWLPYLQAVAGKNSEMAFQYAVALVENGELAEAHLIFEDLSQKGNPYAAHALGSLLTRADSHEQALPWYQMAWENGGRELDASFSEDLLAALLKCRRFDEAWALYQSIPNTQRTEAQTLLVCEAAVKLGEDAFLEQAFACEFASIREGAVGLADVWWEQHARQKARADGRAFTPEQIDRTVPLPPNLNFQMFEDI